MRKLGISLHLLLIFQLLHVAPPTHAQLLTASSNFVLPQTRDDNSLAAVRRSDLSARGPDGKLLRLSVAEHLRRGNIYLANRAFAEARDHLQAIIDYYPQDAAVREALLGIGRSYLQSRRYAEAFIPLDKLAREFANSKEGREGLNFSAVALLRMGKAAEAADKYIEYVDRYPEGERIESAYLNVIDTLREAGQPQLAATWIERTKREFPGTPTELNAIFANLRLEVAEGHWVEAVAVADALSQRRFQKGTLTTPAEVSYLRAYSLERAGKKTLAFNSYMAIPDTSDSYYGWLASERLLKMADNKNRSQVNERVQRTNDFIDSMADEYTAEHRQAILAAARSRNIDPRLILAIIRQESGFRPWAKSPAGARGLLQLTIDAAQKYAPSAGFTRIGENELYRPETSIAIGAAYLQELFRLFPQMPEAVVASYNGGEDNVARWVKRARHDDAGVITAEIGFEETKDYVRKVMTNYRAYLHFFTPGLERR